MRQRCGEDGFVVVRAPYTDVDVKVPCTEPKDAASSGRKMLQGAVDVAYPGGSVYVGKECGPDGFVLVQAPGVNTAIKIPCNRPVKDDSGNNNQGK